MSESEAAASSSAPSGRWRPDTPARAVQLGVVVVAVLEAVHMAATLLFEAVPDAGWLLERGNYRVGVVVSVLSGLTAAALAYGRSADQRDREQRRQELGWSEARLAAVLEPVRPRLRGALACALVVAPVGVFLLTASDTTRPFVVTDEPWTPALAWALFANLLLFALIGLAAHSTWSARRVERALDASPLPLDLLDLAPARARAATGMRRSFFWLASGALATPVLVDLDFSWMTGLVVSAALAIGAALFLEPLLRLARRIERAKADELARIRVRLRAARDALLTGAEGAAAPPAWLASELPALLGYEKRIEEVRPIAIGAPQLLRFGSLLLLALGSWLGGALVDLLVERSLR
jgi:hypothetical protein